jgi:hypothetical protein
MSPNFLQGSFFYPSFDLQEIFAEFPERLPADGMDYEISKKDGFPNYQHFCIILVS